MLLAPGFQDRLDEAIGFDLSGALKIVRSWEAAAFFTS
jgi:hypothetical protein